MSPTPSGHGSTGATTAGLRPLDAERDAALRHVCGLLIASLPHEGLEEVLDHLVEAHDFHTENRRLPPLERQKPVVTTAIVSGRVSRPTLVLDSEPPHGPRPPA